MSPTFYYYSVFRTNSNNSVFYYMDIQIEISDDFEHNVQNSCRNTSYRIEQ